MSEKEIRRQPGLAVSPRATSVPSRRKARDHSLASRRTRVLEVHRIGMDMTWLTDRIAVGGGIWTADNMAAVARAGVTHIINMQIEFDDTQLAAPHGIEVLWNATDDDFEPKPPELFERGVAFGLAALDEPGSKLFIHCAAGVHRAPMMALALLGAMGWELGEAMELIAARRAVADFADVYVNSVAEFLAGQG
jgi:Dual specificity phosphatase, catalytic domain